MVEINSQARQQDHQHALLLDAVKTGDRDAFTQLYRIFYAPLTRFAHRYLQAPELIEEVVNDTLLTLWQKADSFRGDARVSTWLFGITARKCWKASRNLQTQQQKEQAIEPFAELADTNNSLDQLSQQQVLAWAMDHLSEEHRASIELAYGEGFTCEEIAQIMECPTNTVKTRLHHARKILREKLSSGEQALSYSQLIGGHHDN